MGGVPGVPVYMNTPFDRLAYVLGHHDALVFPCRKFKQKQTNLTRFRYLTSYFLSKGHMIISVYIFARVSTD